MEFLKNIIIAHKTFYQNGFYFALFCSYYTCRYHYGHWKCYSKTRYLRRSIYVLKKWTKGANRRQLTRYLGRGCARSRAEALCGAGSAPSGGAPLADDIEADFTCVLPPVPLPLVVPFLLSGCTTVLSQCMLLVDMPIPVLTGILYRYLLWG